MIPFPWPEENDKYLLERAHEVTAMRCASDLNITVQIAYQEARRLGVKFKPPNRPPRIDVAATSSGTWDGERVALLERLWIEGKSASEIAVALEQLPGRPRFSRCAIIGKIHRLGLPRRSEQALAARWDRRNHNRHGRKPPKPSKAARRIHAAAVDWRKAADNVVPFAEPPAPEVAQDLATVPFLELNGRHQCGWHMGGDRWCAEPKASFFCTEHAKIGGGGRIPPRKRRKLSEDVLDIIARRVNCA